ncbi:LOW QUALITY PROTEIN: GH3 domain-containing protein [Ascaphus truei]|uniref:LOW QUALITY PROTEIN: GH3 domain-containing protein n=1 Tax=Ascaphus truei TaxID=8439 RepID=UPI003F5A97BA
MFLFFVLLLGGGGLLYVALCLGRKVAGWRRWLGRWRCLRRLSRGKQRQRLESDTRDVKRVQETLLLHTLREHGETEYGQKHHFRDMQDVSSFQRLHPLTRYHHYKDYILRVSRGEENVLLPGRPLALLATSGTSGSPAAVPVTAHSAEESFLQGTAVCMEVVHRCFPRALQDMVKFSSSSSPTPLLSEAGIPTGPSPPASSSEFLRHLYSSPPPVHGITSHHQVRYIQLLFALKDPALGAIEANFSWLLREVFSILEAHWESLARDIQLGRVSRALELPQGTRRQIEDLLVPDPRRANDLRAQFETGFEGIAKRVWPGLQLVMAVASGGSELDAQILRDTACRGVPLYSPVYGAAEGVIGVNLWPTRFPPRYVLCPRSAFFEFIPLGVSEEEQPGTLCVQDVREGEMYELVISNRAGLYRYRLGDVVRITGFHNQSPLLEFLHRKSQTLSVRGERISEDGFYKTLRYATRQWPGAVLLNYCCAESGILGRFSGGSDPHYEVFVALKGVRDLSEDQRYKLDHSLQEHFSMYKSFRFKGSIGPVRVHLVRPESFRRLRELAASLSGAPLDCTPPPRTLRYRELVESIQRQVFS